MIVGVGLVGLEHGELGIPAPSQAFVAEVAVDLVDAVEAADDQALQIKLGRDAQVEIHVERVVMGDERPRDGAAGDGLHHRRFDFDEAVRVEGAAHRLHQLRALQKDFAHLGIHHQVDIALAVAQFDVGEPVPLLGQGQQVFAEEGDLLDVDAEFAGAGAEQISADADVVAEVEQFVELESLVADGIFLDVDLQPLAALLEVGESGLAHEADRHDASGDADISEPRRAPARVPRQSSACTRPGSDRGCG